MDKDLVSARTRLHAAVGDTPDTIEQVIDQLERVRLAARSLTPRGDNDGIACFTKLYHRITCSVRDAHARGGYFEGGDFILRLDVAFARRYLAALRDDLGGNDEVWVPTCWRELFDRRRDDVEPWRFAAAGVNAHVNFDLAFALLDVWLDDPTTDDEVIRAQHADYDRINDIFAREMDQLQEDFDGPGGWVTDVLGDGSPADDTINWVSDLLVTATREVAWHFALKIWRDRDEPGYHEKWTRRLDRVACCTGGFALGRQEQHGPPAPTR